MAQDPLQEHVIQMERAVFDLLTLFLKSNQTLPDVIIMWRDGLSEGQFRTVMQEELKSIKAVGSICMKHIKS